MGALNAHGDSNFLTSKISQLMEEFQQLHQRLANRYLHPSSSAMDSNVISATFINSLPLKIATVIGKMFLQDLRSRTGWITGLRATLVYPMATDENPWLIVEWIENGDTEAMAIYQIAEDSGICGYLMHLSVLSPVSKREDTSRR